jgi:acetyl-CoA carboxylase carboxyltransferase component
MLRAYEIALENRLPLLFLVESGGADLPAQAEIFVPGGAMFRNLTRLSGARVPTIALVFGNSTAGGAYLPGMSDHVVMVKERAKVFLGGPPLVKMATGEEATDEELGGAEMHARRSGLADFMAESELDALRIGRRIVARLAWRKQGPGPSAAPREPLYDPEELLGIPSADLKVPFPVREVLARLVDGSELDEWKPLYGTNLVTGWARLHGFDVGILANDRGVLFSEEAQKAAHFIQLANQLDVPLLFVQNVTGYMVGREYEQRGIIKHGSMMVNAVSNSAVPHLTLQVGGSYGAGNYGMCGRAYRPRFLFVWPNAKTAVMGPEQLAGTLSLVARQSAAAAGRAFDEEADAQRRRATSERIEAESLAPFTSGRLLDDGILDPRDTRAALGVALSAVHSAPVRGAPGFGVFRM